MKNSRKKEQKQSNKQKTWKIKNFLINTFFYLSETLIQKENQEKLQTTETTEQFESVQDGTTNISKNRESKFKQFSSQMTPETNPKRSKKKFPFKPVRKLK